MMKVVYRTAVRTFLCSGLLLGSGMFARAQEPTGQQAAPAVDNTKVNERDRSKDEPAADQQKDNRSDLDITRVRSTGKKVRAQVKDVADRGKEGIAEAVDAGQGVYRTSGTEG
jgi:hypothetical protein